MKRRIYTFVMLGTALLFMAINGSSCQDDYLKDGGTTSPYYDGTVMQYLESRPDLFADLVSVIKNTQWESVLSDPNEEITFFVPTDFSIERSVDYLNRYLYENQGMDMITSLNQVKSEVWEDMISMYVIKGKYRLNDIAQIDTTALSTYPGQTNQTYDKKYKMTMGVCYGDANGIKYAGYRQVMYDYPEGGESVYAYVSSCNIEPDNGIVHVLRLDHYLGFMRSMLYSKAYEAGIMYPDDRKKMKNILKTKN